MGNGATTLTNLQQAELAKEMKQKYDKYQADKLSDEELRQKMSLEYQKILQDMIANPLKALNGSKQKKPPVKKIVTRRKSFEQGNKIRSKSQENTHSESTHDSPVVPSTPPSSRSADGGHSPRNGGQEAPPKNADVWDSVKEQPTCVICKMIFPSISKLDTHLKYSELHIRNVADLEKAKQVAAPEEEVKPIESKAPCVRCRELYSGSKFYWRTKDNIDFSLYLHLAENCIEVIPYKSATDDELPRLYFDERLIVDYITEDVIRNNVEEKKLTLPIDQPLPSDDLLYENERRIAVSSHLVARLVLTEQTDDTGTKKLITYNFTAPIHNAEAQNPLLSVPPQTLIPVKVVRRRLSNSDEIATVLNEVSQMSADLEKSTQAAESTVSKLVDMNANLLNAGVKL